MIASEVGLGIKPSKQFLFLIVATPSGAYFSGESVKVYIERDDIRCAPGGVGQAKTGGNYAASLKSYAKTIELGCDQTLWLDSSEHKFIEEMSGMNFFAVIDGKVKTPSLTDTILDGITRKSIIEMCLAENIPVEEKKLSIDEILQAIKEERCQEAFVCGTAAVIAPIESFLDKDQKKYSVLEPAGKMSRLLREKLINLQAGRTLAPENWLHQIPEIQF
jgi:branched-chain amino acid aminotransferase